MENWTKHFRNSLLLLLVYPGWLHGISASGGDYQLTKCLAGASGVNQVTSADYGAAYALGEDAAGVEPQNSDSDLVTGYFSGYASGITGTFNLVSAAVGTTKILQDGYQVGVPLNASVSLNFSSQLDATTIANGIQVALVMDHLGQSQNIVVPSSYTYDVTGSTLVITMPGGWKGNTLYDVIVNTSLQSIDGFVLPQEAHTLFVTVLDPHEENVVLHPIPVNSGAQALGLTNTPELSLDIPTDSLSDFSYVLVSQDPIHSPLAVDPKILEAATQQTQNSGGPYQTPLALEEIAAYNQQGQPVSTGKAITFSISNIGGPGLLNNSGAPVRTETVSLWALDSTNALWVKMPDSRPNGTGVAGAVTRFSVYALIGSAAGDASSVSVFPNPWRPYGPNAGTGSGHTGTQEAGITFTNLPSECDITIYTMNGDRVRKLHHSDIAGPVAEEKWDGNISSGEHAASGVYLWRVESSADSKNGKLLVIR